MWNENATIHGLFKKNLKKWIHVEQLLKCNIVRKQNLIFIHFDGYLMHKFFLINLYLLVLLQHLMFTKYIYLFLVWNLFLSFTDYGISELEFLFRNCNFVWFFGYCSSAVDRFVVVTPCRFFFQSDLNRKPTQAPNLVNKRCFVRIRFKLMD